MAFKVSVEEIKVFPHPNADRMEIARVGDYDLVVEKGKRKDGDKIIFAPKRTILPEFLRPLYVNADTGISYLKGPDNDRVGSVSLRGELSEGVTIDFDDVKHLLDAKTIDDLVVGEDISEAIGASEWVPPIPTDFAGKLSSLSSNEKVSHHDVFALATSIDSFGENEDVIVTEKLHGTQISVFFPDASVGPAEIKTETNEDGKTVAVDPNSYACGRLVKLSSKSFISRDLTLLEDERNIYWKAMRNSTIGDMVAKYFKPTDSILIFGEVVPAQKGFNYGFDKHTILIYRIDVNGKTLSLDDVRKSCPEFLEHWVPVLYEGPFDQDKFKKLAKGKEAVSGNGLHIKEGVVISPRVPRLFPGSTSGMTLMVKVINPKYKGSDEDMS